MSNVRSYSALGLVIASLSAGSAQAAVDTTVTDAITAAGTDVSTIGAAMLGLAVIAMTFKWLKASFF